MSVTKNVVRGF